MQLYLVKLFSRKAIELGVLAWVAIAIMQEFLEVVVLLIYTNGCVYERGSVDSCKHD